MQFQDMNLTIQDFLDWVEKDQPPRDLLLVQSLKIFHGKALAGFIARSNQAERGSEKNEDDKS